MRLLHMIDPADPAGGPCTIKAAAEAIARTPGFGHDALVIGTTDHLALARRCGLKPRGRLGPPLNQPVLARGGLRRFLEAQDSAGRRYDLIHAWTGLAASAVPRGRRVIVSVAGDRWRLRCGRAGAWAEAWAGVDASAIAPEQRRLLREQWGADETCFVVGLLGEPASAADGEHAINAAGRAALTGRDVRLVMHDRAAPQRGMRRWLRRLGLPGLVIPDDRVDEPWRIAAALDAALLAGRPRRATRPPARTLLGRLGGRRRDSVARGSGVMAGLWALAGGVPLIVDRDQPAGRLLPRASAPPPAPGDFNGLAARILDLFDRPAEARALGAAGRALAVERYNADGFARTLAVAWRQAAAGEPLSLDDEPAPTPMPEIATVVHDAKLTAESS